MVLHRKHEAASDRRAVELNGDPEALVRALIKLHAFGRLPRRLSVEMERRSSHPSLASRVRAIRALAKIDAGAGKETAFDPVVVRAPGRRGLIFEKRRLVWLEELPDDETFDPGRLRDTARSTRILGYDELVELRVRVDRGRRPRLVARETNGREWRMNFDESDVGRLQQALDAIDIRLAPLTEARPEWRSTSALLACATALAGITSVGLCVTIAVALLTSFVAHPAALAALGVAALGDGISLLLRSTPPLREVWFGLPFRTAGVVLMLMGLGSLLLCRLTAWKETAGRTKSAPWIALALTAAAVLTWLPFIVALSARNVVWELHRSAQGRTSTWLLPLGAAAALIIVRRGWAWISAALAVIAAVVPLTLGSCVFRATMIGDPLLCRSRSLHCKPRSVDVLLEVALKAPVRALRLSPSGTTVAYLPVDDDEDEETAPRRFHVLRQANSAFPRTVVDAVDFEFLDELRALLLIRTPNGLHLRVFRLDTNAMETTAVALPDLYSPDLVVDVEKTGTRFLVTGRNSDETEYVRLVGDLESRKYAKETWTLSAGDFGVALIATPGGAAFSVGYSPALTELGLSHSTLVLALSALLPRHFALPGDWEIQRLENGEPVKIVSTPLMTQCAASMSEAERILCLSHDGEETSVAWIGGTSGEIDQRLSLPGALYPIAVKGSNLIACGTFDRDRIVVVDLESRNAGRLVLPRRREEHIAEIVARRDMLGFVSIQAEAGARLSVVSWKRGST